MARVTYSTAVVIIPPEELWPGIQAIREKHDRKIRRWMPHITLVYPFWPREEFGRAAELLVPVCQRLPSFELRLERFGVLAHGRGEHTMWLDPEPGEPVGRLYAAIREGLGLGLGKDTRAFRPHLSVGQVRGKEEAKRLIEELQASWRPITFRATEVSLIWRSDPPEDVFRVGERLRFHIAEASSGQAEKA